MSQFPDTFSDSTQAVPADKLGPAGQAAMGQLAEAGYEVHTGLTKAYAEAIIAMAREPAIREFCPNDIGSRFADLAATEQWLAKQRGVFLLLKKDEDLKLAGYGWVGLGESSHVPGGQTTFAIRIGQLGQGQGLATSFSKVMVDGSAALYGARNMWLETWQSNGGAVHVYHKVGFQDVDQEASQRPTAGGGSVADTRLFMSLSDDLLLN